MPYDPYAVIAAQQIRDQQIAHAAEHRLGQLARRQFVRRSAARPVGRPILRPVGRPILRPVGRPILRPVGRALVRLGHALGGGPEPTALQPARPR